MRSEEMQIQMAVVRFLKAQYPDALFTSVPCWGQGQKQGAKNKALGLRKGWPDLFIAEHRHGYFGLFVELKTSHGRVTVEQRDVMARLERKGYKTAVTRGFDDAVDELNNYLL